jgi:hypothetical protein
MQFVTQVALCIVGPFCVVVAEAIAPALSVVAKKLIGMNYVSFKE